jgi:hypothetical protein
MADLPPLRVPGAAPQRETDSKVHFTIPGGALGSLAFLLVQLVGVVIWAANEHSQRIELQHQFEEFKTNMRDRAGAIERSIDHLDNTGTRGLALVQERQNNNSGRANLIEDRISSVVSRLDVQGGFLGKMDQRLDVIERKLFVSPPSPLILSPPRTP